MPPAVAVTVTVWSADGLPAVAVKLAVVEPEATVTEAGTASAALLLDRLTANPPPPAVLVRVTVQLAAAAEATLAGQFTEDSCTGAVLVSEKVRVMPLMVAVRVAEVSTATAAAVAVKVALVAAAATVTEAGTVTLALLDESETVIPPANAPALSVTVQVEVAGP
ncbi:MAG: hypothetical protein HYR60_26865 [Acidobacteria bacterium]|nr:hypothetical protein [Acidobacteriota bacterium]